MAAPVLFVEKLPEYYSAVSVHPVLTVDGEPFVGKNHTYHVEYHAYIDRFDDEKGQWEFTGFAVWFHNQQSLDVFLWNYFKAHPGYRMIKGDWPRDY